MLLDQENLIKAAKLAVPSFKWVLGASGLLALAAIIVTWGVNIPTLLLVSGVTLIFAVALVVMQWISRLRPEKAVPMAGFVAWSALIILVGSLGSLFSSATLDVPWPIRTWIQRSLIPPPPPRNSDERLRTMFDTVSVETTFEIDVKDSTLADFAQQLHDFSAPILESNKFPSSVQGWDVSMSGGVDTNGKIENKSLHIGDPNIFSDRALQQSIPTLAKLGNFFRAMQSPDLVLSFYRPQEQNSEPRPLEFENYIKPDLWMGLTQKVSVCYRYAPKKNRLFVYWNQFIYPKNTWRTNTRICAVSDLSNATMKFSLGYGIVPPAQKLDDYEKLRPIRLNIHFGPFQASFTEFRQLKKGGGRIEYQAIIPNSKYILDGSAYRPSPEPWD